MRKALRFVEFEGGCLIPLSHKHLKCGHFLKGWGDELEYFHRFIWRAHHGEIPEGHEVHHTCETPACQNINHMVCISKSEHSTLTATDQFDHASKEAKEFWLEHQCSADTLKTMFGLSRSTAYRWIQRWT